MRYPAGWRSETAERDGVWSRSFLAPPADPQQKHAVSATLIAGELRGSLEEYAQTLLAQNTLTTSREETRGGARGRSYLFHSPDGATRHCLLLVQEDDRVFGLHAQGQAPLFERHFPTLEEMTRSLTLERPGLYPEHRDEKFGVSVRIPPSWRETRSFSGGGTLLRQFQSPALAMDGERQTLHAFLNLTVEKTDPEEGLDGYYSSTRRKLGDAFLVLSHGRWKDGYADLMQTESTVAVSRVKRFYRVDGGRGYSASFEAREDVYLRAARWYDVIASTLKTRSELGSE